MCTVSVVLNVVNGDLRIFITSNDRHEGHCLIKYPVTLMMDLTVHCYDWHNVRWFLKLYILSLGNRRNFGLNVKEIELKHCKIFKVRRTIVLLTIVL